MPSSPRLFYGWIVTACAFCVLFLTYGVQYSFGVFLPAMLDELGWQRASIAGAFSLYSMMYSGCSLISGRLTDSRGPQFVIALGGVLLGLGIIATSRMSAMWHMYVFYGLIASLGMSTAYIPCNATVVKWFQRKRGLALGLASSGSSCGILICPPLASHLIAQWGWRPVYCAGGVTILLLLNVVARFMVRSPELLGLAPDGDTPSPTGLAPASPSAHANDASQPVTVIAPSGGWTLQQAWRLPAFWLLFVVFVIMLLTVPVPFVHIVAYARDLGFSPTQGALAVSLMGLCAFVGSLSLGPLSDRIGRKQGLRISLILQVVAFLLFLSANSLGQLYCGAAAFGFFYGSMATLFPALIGDFFSRLHAGTITGFLFAGAGILGAWGPMIAGYLRDTSGSYHVAFMCSIATSVVALSLFLLTPKPPPSPGATGGLSARESSRAV
ncbi:MAG: MFS transporter [Deltaproteobacteria bacterium]|nr:MFS transporter [Deltaproteobacteria bacterium]